MKFKRLARGLYKAESEKPEQYIAFVFRCPKPIQLWAWCVWRSDNRENAGVEFTQKIAKEKAAKVIA